MNEPRVEVDLTGGLANQMFQWAAGAKLAAEAGVDSVFYTQVVDRPNGRGLQVDRLDPSADFRRPGRVSRNIWRVLHDRLPDKGVGVFRRMAKAAHVRPRRVRNYADARSRLAEGHSVRLSGLFQEVDELVVRRDAYRDLVRLTPPAGLPQSYAAVHVRRGDYVAVDKFNRMFGVCHPDYYLQGLQRLSPGLPIVFATDDVAWVQQFLTTLPADIRSRSSLSTGRDHFEDLGLLAGARELVLANSTFSWWGGFLSRAELVVRPDPWFTDEGQDQGLALSDWVAVPREARISA